ncbi:MAG: metallophosphatase family protein [Dysgonamonadaceae bacterium]|jgi:putative phosphoesterase|nr:metallophosphatase family protein [Dysgonamonadaceae bacterium]
MKKIGLLSDSHGTFDVKFQEYFTGCDEIWHAGDIGSEEVLHKLQTIAEVRAVHGNIDVTAIRRKCPEMLRFRIEEVDVMMTHIGGYPNHYNPQIRQQIIIHRPKLFICGHSHILRVMYDRRFDMLYLNPGESQKHPRNGKRTLLRFTINKENIKDMEVIEFH